MRMKQFGIENTIAVYRVGDKLSDPLKMPRSELMRNMIGDVSCVLTKPELEVLMLINEGMADRYFRVEKTASKPSSFYTALHPEYHKGYDQVKEYFGKLSDSELVMLLRKYDMMRKKTHPKGALSFYDLLTDEAKMK